MTQGKKNDGEDASQKDIADRVDIMKNEQARSKDSKSSVEKKKAMQLNNEMHERLGFGLKSMYRNVLEEPLPLDMMALLDQLSDETDKQSDKSENDGSGSN